MVGTRSQTKEGAPAIGSCSICTEPDDEEMVQCDLCDLWFHFVCVGVNKEIANKDWTCMDCDDKGKKAKDAEDTVNQNLSDNESFRSPENINQNNKVCIDTLKISTSVASGGGKLNRRDLDLQLSRLQEEHELKMLFLKQKYEIISICDRSESDDDCSVQEGCITKKNNVASLGIESNVNCVPQQNLNNNLIRDIAQQQNIHFINPSSSTHLEQSQIYARQITPQELPVFSGKPEEWPLFISSYENSTRMCGFSNEENMLRLQRALRGKALDYVGNRLTLPALVPQVISTLRILFGRAENIIQNLITKLRDGPNVNTGKLETLVHFSLDVKNVVATMEAANLTTHLCNPMLMQELIEKLPSQMRLEWAIKARKIGQPNLSDFSDWLFDLADAASNVITITPTNNGSNEKRKASRLNVHREENNSNKYEKEHYIKLKLKCYGCNDPDHFIAACAQFKKLDYQKKWEIVNKRKLCRSCLKIHNPRFCKDRKECTVDNCTAKHHPLLHKPSTCTNVSNHTPLVAMHGMTTSNVLYRIVPVLIHGRNTALLEYAFLDEGSGPTLIEKSVLDRLDLNGTQSELCLKWTDGSVLVENKSERLDLEVSPCGKNKMKYLLKDVRSISKLDLPKQTLMFSELTNKYKHLRGLQVESYQNITPKMIIGLSNKMVATPLKVKEGHADEPAALKTRLGWTIYGTTSSNVEDRQYLNSTLQLHICECNDDVTLSELVKRNMELEDEGTVNKKAIEDIMMIKKNTKRTGKKFTANLLWKYDNIIMPNNYEMALRRMLCFERKLDQDKGLAKFVADQIEDMLKKDYIRKLNKEEIQEQYPRKWYLPIFVVKNPNKPNKFRLVWDAAAKYQGLSLNCCLNKGPDLIAPLKNVLFNFRIGKIGVSGDIAEMFHQVKVNAEDTQSQRFLWRSNLKQEPDVYVLQVMSFGACCSPSLAQCVKNSNAEEFREQYPRAVKSIIERHYVDDMLDSADSIEETIELAQQVKYIHAQGNFCIRNWMSNSKEVLKALGEKSSDNSFCRAGKMVENVVEPEKVLGMWWHTENDAFTFNLKFTKATAVILSGSKLPSKRELLRLLMSIFDPLGLIAFYTVQMKILMQRVWRSGITWDETIPEELSEDWLRWLSVLKNVERLMIPRCYLQTYSINESKIQLHVFADASENAFAAVAYFRIQTRESIQTVFVCSKTKVAPLRPISIPRMELLAAVLGARLAKAVSNGHDLKIESTHFWTDSKTVLQWLKSDARCYKQFVMFRIAEIQEITNVSNWNFLPSKENIADLATKWVRQPTFDSKDLWFTGPVFLRKPPTEWPKIKNYGKTSDEAILQHVAVQQQNTSLIDYTRFSKWERLFRSLAYVKRFIDLKAIGNEKTDERFLASEQLLWSQRYLIRLTQSHTYGNEITMMKDNPAAILPKTSELRKLSPFLDDDMIVRLRGRLENAIVIHDHSKNPIILPRKHYITRLIVDYYHRKYKHVHHETVINEIFQRFHIPGLRTLLRNVRSQCQNCKNRKAEPNPPEMGQLPIARTSAFTKPFSYVGVDFFGPFIVTVGRRNEKRYGAVFTCLTTRAIHIEMVYSMNTSSCIMAIKNFISRRGRPLQIYSDNGTNLKGAEKELRELHKKINFHSLQNELTTEDIKWVFIPPASPHMGGAWERLVRSIKNVLYQIITPDVKLNDEKLNNLFLEVENIINSRPLTYLSLETAEQEALTPNHFLLGTSSGEKPAGKFDASDQYLRKTWRHTQFLADLFWRRWVAEILPTMAKRTNWFQRVKPIAEGDIVIIVDPNLPRHTWPKGIIVKTIQGKDGQVRSAIVKSQSGVYHRPAAKLAVLDVKPEM